MVNWLIYYYRRVRDRKGTGLAIVFSLLLACVFLNATCFWLFDGPPGLGGEANADLSYGDAVWYSIISITTIGYGDLSASSTGARISTILFIVIIGLSTFTIFFGMMVDWITDWIQKGQLGMGKIVAEDHVLLVNFPSAARVIQLIEELRADSQHRSREVVIITDAIEKLPFSISGVSFVNGSPIQNETYERAAVHSAKMALILATSYGDTTSDAVVASAASVIDRMNQSIHIVAECLEEKHRMLFNAVRCNAVVPGLRIVGNLLVQEIHDPGISQMIDVITSNMRGHTLFSARVEEDRTEVTYCQIAKSLVDRDVNLLCVNRGEDTLTAFRDLRPCDGDTLIYVTERRWTWQELIACAQE